MLKLLNRATKELRGLYCQTRLYMPKAILLKIPIEKACSKHQNYENKNTSPTKKRFYPFYGATSLRKHSKLFRQNNQMKEKYKEKA